MRVMMISFETQVHNFDNLFTNELEEERRGEIMN